ncbi:hypothetical protein [Burkholderia vietnamiensis]|uniref:hypothetical protein n=1 Tax=Burkholderia vietnamiensis TaxID=60552 RepID=UPI001B9D3CA4|nr:hypothetical protein [Burkholderia vietnamiensis]MBR8007417.1 hypothetical protein [Burkholderia vietnamiensis]
MRIQFTADGINRLKRDAKLLRRGTFLTQTQALDRVAEREGWPNWALLQKHSVVPSATASLELIVEPFVPGDRGVFFLKLAILDAKTLAALERMGGLSFELPPAPANWIFRRFTPIQHSQPDPFLDNRPPAPRGRFVGGKFFCIVSTNGVQPANIEAEIAAQLSPIGARFRHAALEALEALLATSYPTARVRLFFSRPGKNGVNEIDELTFASLEAAKSAKLPADANPIGIPTPDGWWVFQSPFGWQAPKR